MKKIFKFKMYLFLSLALAFVNFSCSDNDSENGEIKGDTKEETLAAIAKQYVNNTVIITYKSMADESINLYDAAVKLKANKTNENVKAVADSWVKTRDYWELSEAWLYGPAENFGIDPHIDTWPLDVNALENTILNNDNLLQKMASENGDIWAGNNLEEGLQGFHGIEYIIFKDGELKDISKITDEQLTYITAIAGDLRNQCFRLEAAWAGVDNVSAEKRAKLTAWNPKMKIDGIDYYYGETMLDLSKTNLWNSSTDVCEAIIEGCITIADEVGAMKIGKPYSGEDTNYIESVYSYNSIIDFVGNIKSIQNAYVGGVEGRRGASLSAYVKSVDAAVDAEIQSAIENAITKIEAIPFPFTKYYSSSEAGEAMKACNDLGEILIKAKTIIRK